MYILGVRILSLTRSWKFLSKLWIENDWLHLFFKKNSGMSMIISRLNVYNTNILKGGEGKSVRGKLVSPLQKFGSRKMAVTKSDTTDWISVLVNNSEWLVSEQSGHQGHAMSIKSSTMYSRVGMCVCVKLNVIFQIKLMTSQGTWRAKIGLGVGQ